MTITPRSPSAVRRVLLHRGRGGLAHQQRADEIHLDHLAEEIARHRAVLAKQAPRRPDAGAVHRDIEAAQKRYGCGDRRIDRGFRGDVHAVKAGGGAKLGHGGRTRVGVEIEQRHAPAARDQRTRGCKSEPRAPTGDRCARTADVHDLRA